MPRHTIPAGARGICGCRQPVTKVLDFPRDRWVHDAGFVAHQPFAITAVTR